MIQSTLPYRRYALLLCTLTCVLLFLWAKNLNAESETNTEQLIKLSSDSDHSIYRPTLAGKEFKTVLLGYPIHIEPRDRDSILSLTLGGISFSPLIGGSDALPFAALYWKHGREKYQIRAVLSILDNEIDLTRSFDEFELLGHLENKTNPFPTAEIVNGREVRESSIIWGTFSGWLGTGWRRPVAPFQSDNSTKFQLYYHSGYLYSKPVADTGRDVRLPPDTMVHGIRFRIRHDGFHRNLMELPHQGWAGGIDLELARRNRWSGANYGGSDYSEDSTRDYAKFSGYLTAATGIPYLSDRNRFLCSIYGGFAPGHNLDRFSAFRIGGGPFSSENTDLIRYTFPGAMFNQFPVSDYVIGTLEYRRELLFFLFLHLRNTFVWANRNVFTSQRQKYSEAFGEAFSIGLTSGFISESQLYLEYNRDNGILRNGPSGESMLLLWSKNF